MFKGAMFKKKHVAHLKLKFTLLLFPSLTSPQIHVRTDWFPPESYLIICGLNACMQARQMVKQSFTY